MKKKLEYINDLICEEYYDEQLYYTIIKIVQ